MSNLRVRILNKGATIMTYRDKIREAYDTLSPSFKVLAEFILDQTYVAAFLNA